MTEISAESFWVASPAWHEQRSCDQTCCFQEFQRHLKFNDAIVVSSFWQFSICITGRAGRHAADIIRTFAGIAAHCHQTCRGFSCVGVLKRKESHGRGRNCVWGYSVCTVSTSYRQHNWEEKSLWKWRTNLINIKAAAALRKKHAARGCTFIQVLPKLFARTVIGTNSVVLISPILLFFRSGRKDLWKK